MIKSYLKYAKPHHWVILMLLTMICITAIISLNSQKDELVSNGSGKFFAGSESCRSCHREIVDSYLRTAHYNTSNPANAVTIKGSFAPGANIFQLNGQLSIAMVKTDSGFFQAGLIDGKEVVRKRFDITVGSAKKGQTYLYWYKDRLVQLPISYYTPLRTWCNSPGYPTNRLMYGRNISTRCLECHATYFTVKNTTEDVDELDKNKYLLHIECERCHGPGEEHVTFQLRHPDLKAAKFIINPVRLSRGQKLDNCALCHSGFRENIKNSFSFVTGDTLEKYSRADYNKDTSRKLDVHANQYGLLSSSKCFLMSKMDCSSCHNTHTNESGNIQLFSRKCMNCHNAITRDTCRQERLPGLTLAANCIDCHMPLKPTNKFFLTANNSSARNPDLIRTHYITIYKNQTEAYLKDILKKPMRSDFKHSLSKPLNKQK